MQTRRSFVYQARSLCALNLSGLVRWGESFHYHLTTLRQFIVAIHPFLHEITLQSKVLALLVYAMAGRHGGVIEERRHKLQPRPC